MRTTHLLPCAAGAALLASPALVLADTPTLDERLERLVERLEQQRIEMNIPGMAIAVVKDDQVVLARGFGVRDVENELPADEHTMFAVGSSTKAFTATLIGMLIDEGRMDWDDPIVKHLPEFRLHDDEASEQATLRDALCHRSGLSAFQARLSDSAIYDWDAITAVIAEESPWWEPGSAQGYSPFIYGWSLGELVRRVGDYPDFNACFQAQVAEPLAINCRFGVPAAEQPLLADGRPQKRDLAGIVRSNGADSAALGQLMKADPRGVTNRAFANPMSLMTATNTSDWRKAQIPAANGHASARALAAVYGALANQGRSAEGANLLPPELVPLCWDEQSFEQDRVLGLPLRFSHGFMLSQPRPDCRFGRGARAFGHPGAGGCLGFADPDYRLGFGYVTARMGQSILIDQRAIRLIDTLYDLLEGDL
jgi:CubicO group peptidase (beta-lactamase class C family)